MKAAFLSYNAIPGFNSGWHKGEVHSALVIPNSRGDQLAAVFMGESGNNAVTDEITRLWIRLSESLSDIDKVIVYVGDNGSEVAIDLAGRLPANQVVYVLCDCNLEAKRQKIAGNGHQRAKEIICECRGMSTMSRLAREFLRSGQIS